MVNPRVSNAKISLEVKKKRKQVKIMESICLTTALIALASTSNLFMEFMPYPKEIFVGTVVTSLVCTVLWFRMWRQYLTLEDKLSSVFLSRYQ